MINDIEEVNAEQEEKSAEDKEVSEVASSSKKKETNVKERASKSLIWKYKELDPKTCQMYEKVVSATKEIDNLKTKNKRYCFSHFIHHSNFETKYTKAAKK